MQVVPKNTILILLLILRLVLLRLLSLLGKLLGLGLELLRVWELGCVELLLSKLFGLLLLLKLLKLKELLLV